MSRTIYIYTLADPRDGKIRYVGKTVNMAKRFSEHLKIQKNCHLKSWVEQLKKERLIPIMEEIEQCDSVDEIQWQEAEQFWIVTLRFLGFRLVNIKRGGVGTGEMAEETKRKIAIKATGRKQSPEVLAKLSIIRKGKKMSANCKAALKKANTGRPPTEKQLQARSKIWKGKNLGQNHRDNMKAAWVLRRARGNPLSSETRAKLAAASKKGHEAIRLKRFGKLLPLFQ